MLSVKISEFDLKKCGGGTPIFYGFLQSELGEILIAASEEGICCLEFADEAVAAEDKAEVCSPIPESLMRMFPGCRFEFRADWPYRASDLLRGSMEGEIRLHLKGTEFQLSVWRELAKIRRGETVTYGEIAERIGRPSACRAVGTAVGHNPVSLILPCHRVVPKSGGVGGYRWGSERKCRILQLEREAMESV